LLNKQYAEREQKTGIPVIPEPDVPNTNFKLGKLEVFELSKEYFQRGSLVSKFFPVVPHQLESQLAIWTFYGLFDGFYISDLKEDFIK
jgi:hypothetical protein